MLIILEGLDGVGKTTLANGIYEKLKETLNDKVVFWPILTHSDDINNTEINKDAYKRFKNHEMTEEQTANYLEKVITYNSNIIKQLTDEGKIVITDRHIPSFFVYQVCTSNNPVYKKAFENLNNNIIFPDKTVFVHITYQQELVNKRLLSRDVDKYDKITLANFKTMEDNYKIYYINYRPENSNYILFINNDKLTSSVNQLVDLITFF